TARTAKPCASASYTCPAARVKCSARALACGAADQRGQPECLVFRIGMSMETSLSRITIDPAICHGKSCVRGLRYPVETLLELLSSGMTHDEILADYQDLEKDDLLA